MSSNITSRKTTSRKTMSRRLAAVALVATVALAAAAPAAPAQDLAAIYNSWLAQQNSNMATAQNNIMQQVFKDPKVMEAYKAGVCGEGLTTQQFAYRWAATGGCMPQGNAISRLLSKEELAAIDDYWKAVNSGPVTPLGGVASDDGVVQGHSYLHGGYHSVETPFGSYWYR